MIDTTVTQAAVLERLPAYIVVDFNCSAGPHDWMAVTAADVIWEFCRNCPTKRRKLTWPDTLNQRTFLDEWLRS